MPKTQNKISNKKENTSQSIYQELYNKDTAKDFVFKKIKVRKSFHGLGIFAEENIKKGERIMEYIGNILLGEDADSIVNKYLFQVSKNKTIDGSPRWNTARYINHSCIGNAESEIRKGRVYIIAKKNIKIDEEICYDYGDEYVKELFAKDGCKCSAKKHLYLK